MKAFEQDPVNAFPRTGHLKPEGEEMRRLQRENAILKEERDILKKHSMENGGHKYGDFSHRLTGDTN